MKEEWRAIPGFEGLYEASTLGRLRSLDRVVRHSNGRKQFVAGRMLSPHYAGDKGYLVARPRKPGVNKPRLVHQLIALTFIPNPENKPHINHINFIRDDNRVENLEWVSSYENTHHSIKAGRYKNRDKLFARVRAGTGHRTRLTWEKVAEIRALYATGNHTGRQIGKMYGTCERNILNIVNNKRWKKEYAPKP